MRTKFALAFYYLAIGFLTAVACTIVVKLIFWPPCTQVKNTCVIDPWSAAGLEATVLGVSATVLAVLGAVAVAGWWTALNTRVKDQVDTLYKDQKAEINTRVDTLLADQQKKVGDQLGAVQTSVQSVEGRISTATTDIDELEKLIHDFLDVAVDGIMLSLPNQLETWAKKVTAFHKFPRVSLKMAERYLDVVHQSLPQAEQEVQREKEELQTATETFKSIVLSSYKQKNSMQRLEHIAHDLEIWLDKDAHGGRQTRDLLNCWINALRWEIVAEKEAAETESVHRLQERFHDYRPKIDQLDLENTKLWKDTKEVLSLIEERLPR